MGFLKKIFKGSNKKKTDNKNDVVGNPSFPSATASESRSAGGGKGGNFPSASASASFSTNGSNAHYNNTANVNVNANANNANVNNANPNNPNRYHMNQSSPQKSVGDTFGSPRSSQGPVDTDDDGIIIAATVENVEEYYEKVRHQTQDELRIAYELAQAQKKHQQNQQQNNSLSLSMSMSGDENVSANANHIVDIDDSLSSSSPRLTSNQLQQWDRKNSSEQLQQGHQTSHPQFSSSPTSSPPQQQHQQQQHNPYISAQTQPQQHQHQHQQQQRVYTMSSALPSQQSINAALFEDDMNHSESDASSFNLSTDAEDSEYEGMRRSTNPNNMHHGGYPLGGNLNSHLTMNSLAAGLSALDTSGIDTVGSITSYTTDEDRKIFPNLPTDDEMTLGSMASSKTGRDPVLPSLLLQPLPNPLLVQVPVQVVPVPDHEIDIADDAALETNHRTATVGTRMAMAMSLAKSSKSKSMSRLNNNNIVDTSNDSSGSISIDNTTIKNNHRRQTSLDPSINNISNINNMSTTAMNSHRRQKSLDPSWNDFVANDPANQPTSTKSSKSISRNKPGGTPRSFTTPKSISNTNTNANATINANINANANANANATTSNNDDGFGSSISISGGKLLKANTNDSPNRIRKNNKADNSGGDTTNNGFADFGNFADFSDFSSSKGGAEWATAKEEKKDQNASWENQNREFFENTNTTSISKTANNTASNSHSPFGSNNNNNNDIEDPAWNVNTNANVSSPSAKSYTSNKSPGGSSNSGGLLHQQQQQQQDPSLTELLEAAKSKRKDRRSYGTTSSRHSNRLSTSSSVNSAPAITSSYLRQHHNLGNHSTSNSNSNSNSNTNSNSTSTSNNYSHWDVAGDDLRHGKGVSSGNSYSNKNYVDNRSASGGDETSVSDIINSLEATDRIKRAEQITSHRSMGEAGVVATARAAKERLRERRWRERVNDRERESTGSASVGGVRTNSAIRHSTSHHSDSDDSEGHKNSESWLFDQVTGAIGPVGIAADLESLSGRSNRSKGSKSHKSSSVAGSRRRTSSNRKTSSGSHSRRHHTRSDRSVDSHGSRASRYSHRSTKSFLSQMSEQSRSVANDLLRLEMQLAMVGNNNNNGNNTTTIVDADGMPVVVPTSTRMSSGASLGGGSRASARSTSRKASHSSRQHAAAASSSSVVRRSKTTVVAPPGKLGIILANKADSKGTVVSGVRTSSVLVDRISPGDRIVAIDGEDVSRMTVSEITTIMSRKAEYERRLTVLTASPAASSTSSGSGVVAGGIRSGGKGSGSASMSELRSPTHSRTSPRQGASSVSIGGGVVDYGGDSAYTATGSYRR